MELEPLDIQDARTVASQALDPEDLERAWEEGLSMTLEQAVAYARDLERLVANSSAPGSNR